MKKVPAYIESLENFKEKGYLDLSGDRFVVTYHIKGNSDVARATVDDICHEQTCEFPDDMVPDGDLRDHILGRLEDFSELGPGKFKAVISFAVETTGFELGELLNVVYGNISYYNNIKVSALDLPLSFLNHFKGPRFGKEGLRKLLDVPGRPVLCVPLKPMGMKPAELAELAYQFALGGIDIIKDDHGQANQTFCDYKERVKRCAQAVHDANTKTGFKCVYAPTVNIPSEDIFEKAHFAKEAGAGAFLAMPGLIGLDTMRRIAEDDSLGLPVISHPTFWGSYFCNPDIGFSLAVILGLFCRIAGADSSIFLNYGGRFPSTREECIRLVEDLDKPLGNLKNTFPMPGGGMNPDKVPTMIKEYGREVALLMSTWLFKSSPDIAANSRYFRELAENSR